ncbi:uncharacterized protein LOC124778137 [Schistocerca piceifrons]|uniref:uncharacterized protein LOC124778137 n=1 Tax=Schistocerca piceifrons TaxID=274613 RepID=UPI001F5FAC9C|nr:uncharacterized protein LOC124778137 [Schistocerca piceifrons]
MATGRVEGALRPCGERHWRAAATEEWSLARAEPATETRDPTARSPLPRYRSTDDVTTCDAVVSYSRTRQCFGGDSGGDVVTIYAANLEDVQGFGGGPGAGDCNVRRLLLLRGHHQQQQPHDVSMMEQGQQEMDPSFEPQQRARSNTWPLPRPENFLDVVVKQEPGVEVGPGAGMLGPCAAAAVHGGGRRRGRRWRRVARRR